MNRDDVKRLVIEIAQETSKTDPIDWTGVKFSRESVYSHNADMVLDMFEKTMAGQSKDTQIIALLSSLIHLTVIQFLDEIRRLQNQDDNK